MRLENIFSIAYTFANGFLQLFQLRAAFPAGFEVRTNPAGLAGRRFSVGIAEQLFVVRVAHL